MLQVGPVFRGTLPNETLLWGVGGLWVLGPNFGPPTDWVLLGHESLVTSYLLPRNVDIGYPTAEAGNGIAKLQVTTTTSIGMSYLVAADGQVITTTIDDVATGSVNANGAEVKQWQQ